jgi:hypothetical protein
MAWLILNNEMVVDYTNQDPAETLHQDIPTIELTEAQSSLIDDKFVNAIALTYNGTTLSADMDRLKTYIKDKVKVSRKIKEADGVISGGNRIHTDRESIALMHGAHHLCEIDNTRTVNLKIMAEPDLTPGDAPALDAEITTISNPWITVSAADFGTHYAAALEHIEKCFNAEMQLSADIDAAATLDDILAINIGNKLNEYYSA